MPNPRPLNVPNPKPTVILLYPKPTYNDNCSFTESFI